MNKRKKSFRTSFYIFFAGILILLIFIASLTYRILYNYNISNDVSVNEKLSSNDNDDNTDNEELEVICNVEYIFNEELINIKISEFLETLPSGLSLCYEDLTTGRTIKYLENKVYYGASLIKLVDALYIIENEIDLMDTVKYTSSYQKTDSDYIKTHELGSNISIYELTHYALKYSDNSAHFMLVDYLGMNNLNTYLSNLGSTTKLDEESYFGYQTAKNTNLYLKEAYEVINKYENGIILMDAMINDNFNYLTFSEDVVIAHKYGKVDEVYHDIGIVFAEYPYTISILSNLSTKAEVLFPLISESLYDLHSFIWNNVEIKCV